MSRAHTGPIRILHVVDSLETGGLERGVVNLIRHLDPCRFQHAVCATRNLGVLAEELPPAVPRMCLRKTESHLSLQFRALAAEIRKLRPDIVHSRNWGTIEAVYAARLVGGCAIIHSEHGVETLHGGFEPRRRRWTRRLAFELADRVCAVSNQLRDFYARQTGFSGQRISVLHNGVDTGRFCLSGTVRAHMRRSFALQPDDLCIGTVGRLEPVKDLMTLLRAVSIFGRTRTQWKLLIAGDGRELPALQTFVASQPALQGRVCFAGEISRIPDFLSALDVFVLPSLFEGISNSLLEAMAAGLPAIASATGGNPEVVVDGESGLLFPVGEDEALANRLDWLFSDPNTRLRIGTQALCRVRDHFSLDAMMLRYEQLYGSFHPSLSNASQMSRNEGLWPTSQW